MKILDDLYYAESHEWVKIDNNIAFIGISDYAQNELGEVVYVDLPEEDTEIGAGDVIGSIEAAKAVVDLVSPVSGRIIAVNQDLNDSPNLINESAYENGWIVKVEATDTSELESLMTAKDYKQFVEGK